MSDEKTFKILIIGNYRTGKSTIANALLEQDISPVSIGPCTTLFPMLICYGNDTQYADIVHEDHTYGIMRSELGDYFMGVDFSEDLTIPEHLKNVQSVLLRSDSEFLADGKMLIDFPAIDFPADFPAIDQNLNKAYYYFKIWLSP